MLHQKQVIETGIVFAIRNWDGLGVSLEKKLAVLEKVRWPQTGRCPTVGAGKISFSFGIPSTQNSHTHLP